MAEYCRFIQAAADGGDLALLGRMRMSLAAENDCLGVCLQALSYLQGLRIGEMVMYDHSFIMKQDVVSIYLTGGLPEGVEEEIDHLEGTPAKKQAATVQFGKLLKERLQHGLKDVIESLDGMPGKDLYSRSIAYLLRITMSALRVECKLRKRTCDMDMPTTECIHDETGSSLCEILSQCCLILCIYGAEESHLFDDLKEVQETLLCLAPRPLILHIIGAFAVVAFDNNCTFSLRSRRDFIEALAMMIPDLLERILIFNRMGYSSSSSLSVSGSSLTDSSDGDSGSLNSTWSTSHVKTNGNGVITLETSVEPITDDESHRGVIYLGSSYWEYAFGNVPRFRTLSLLLDFILRYIKVARDGTVEPPMYSWLENLVQTPSFLQAFKPIFSTGDTSNFSKIMELSRILGRDVFVTDLVLSLVHCKEEALRLIDTIGSEIIVSGSPNTPMVFTFLLDGISEKPMLFIKSWYNLLKPTVLENRHSFIGNMPYPLSSQRSQDSPMSVILCSLLDETLPYCMMQNFGDDPHPDDDNVDALSARQLLVILSEIIGARKFATRLQKYIDLAHKYTNEAVTLEAVQMLEFSIFCMWLLRIVDLNTKHKRIHSFSQEVHERTLHAMISVYDAAKPTDDVGVRLEELETLKKRIRADRLKSMVSKKEPWFSAKWLMEIGISDWNIYCAEIGDTMVQQLVEASIAGPVKEATALAAEDNSGTESAGSKRGHRNKETFQHHEVEQKDKLRKTHKVTDYINAVRLLLHLKEYNQSTVLTDDVYATVVGCMVHFNVCEEQCTDIFKMMITCCPLQILIRVVECKVYSVNVALMKAIISNLDAKFSAVISLMMGTALEQSKPPTKQDILRITVLMDLVAASLSLPMLMGEIMATDYGLSLLQNFVVYANGLQASSSPFLASRCAMNFALIECYLQYAVPYSPVPVLSFVNKQIKKLMEARAAKFEMAVRGSNDEIKYSRCATGRLNTLDLIVTSTFERLLAGSAPAPHVICHRWEKEDNDLLRWNLLGREHSIAFKTAALLFKCFSQLVMTKLMFIAEYYIGVAARINDDRHSTARRIVLSDDSMLKRDAIEYFYKAYLNNKKKLASRALKHPSQTVVV